MHFTARVRPATPSKSLLLKLAASVASVAALGTSAQAGTVAQRSAVRFESPFDRSVPGSPVTFTPFAVPALQSYAPQDLTVGPDGNMWITTQGGAGTIVRLAPNGASKAFTYPVGSAGSTSRSITPGPDRALWFVDQDAELVGKITTKGVVTTYALPSNIQNGCQLDATRPLGITAGSDGAMWFTVNQGATGSLSCPSGQNAEIGRITTAGKMSFYSMPEVGGRINSIIPIRVTSGPGGSLWFTTSVGGAIGVGSITIGGAITAGSAFPGTASDGTDDYLTFASNALYVADTYDGAIVRVANYAPAATYPVPGFGSGYGPYGIVPDSHGQLWFTTRTNGGVEKIGSMTSSGKFALHQVPPSLGYGCCGSLAFRETHQLWFSYRGGGSGANVIEATNVP